MTPQEHPTPVPLARPPRRLVCVLTPQQKLVGYAPHEWDGVALEVEELPVGTMLQDLTPTELEAFGDMFQVVADDEPAPGHCMGHAPSTRR